MIRATLISLLGLATSIPAAAQTWNAFNAQALYGSTFELGPAKVETLTLEWANGWTYGDNFVFADITRPLSNGTAIYGEWTPRLSISKLTGKTFRKGVVQDILLSGTLELGNGITNYLIGGAVDFAIPGFNFFQINGYLRENPDLSGVTWQMTVVWDTVFKTGRLRWAFLGYLDWAGSEGIAGALAYEKRNLQLQPQLLLDLGSLMGQPDKVFGGVEWLYWKNKFGVSGVDESVVQVMIKVAF